MLNLFRIIIVAKWSNFNFSIYKTLIFNIYYFDFKTFIKVPVFISNNVILKSLQGTCEIESEDIYSGYVKIGFNEISIFHSKNEKSIWHVESGGLVIFKKNASLGIGTRISVWNNGKLYFGDNFKINAKTTIVCTKEIYFDDDCLLSWNIEILDSDFHKIIDNEGKQINHSKPIKIGKHNWIGSGCKILKGTVTQKNTIIGANSVLSSEFDETNILIVGSPGKGIKKNINWQL